LIGVTNFFRDPEAFESLKNDVLLKLFKSKQEDYYFRVWVPGCSTGEEVYSIAIILRECLEETKRYFNIQIFGTDIDLAALETARSGVYPETIINEITPARFKRFFIKENNKVKVKKEIREMVVFGSQNIIKDPPFTKLDLICCRNLLIYLNQDLQKKLLPIFHYSLKPKGFLFLGTSEAIAGYVDLFKMITKKWKIFERKDADNYTNAVFNFPSISRITELASIPLPMRNLMEGKNDITNAIRRFLLSNYVPPCFVINKIGEILYTHGKVPSYFKSPSIENEFNLFKILPNELRVKIKNTIKKSLLTKKDILNKHLTVKHSGRSLSLNIRVKPLVDIESVSGLVCVIFENIISDKNAQLTQTKYNSITKMSKKIIELEQELQYTKENLQTTIEELQSSNEELQSSNEELQSTNEEIETSKEELQSLNEELVIINTELQTRIDQLASVNDDMNNLFNSTEISAIFLDNDLKIKRFTPKAQDLIHLIQNDVGRSIRHFAMNIKYEKLVEDAEEVLKNLIPKSFEVLSKDGNWYLIRILPYRTLSNVIDGNVITFTDITAHKESEKQLKELNSKLHRSLSVTEAILSTIAQPLLVLNKELKIVRANGSFSKKFGIHLEDIIGKSIFNINQKQLDFSIFKNSLEECIQQVNSEKEYTFNFNDEEIKIKARSVSNNIEANQLLILTFQ
ncbi:MAG: PAS domain-containing protein, partial [Gammaproteobacteria bacterium]|nr:PAS domain-containing protein [Gammaproteobacteria bacterium]